MPLPRPPLTGLVPLHRGRAMARRLLWRATDRTAHPKMPPTPSADRPLRVGFVVCESAKWGLASLVARLQADPVFDVGFYPTLSDLGLRLSRARRQAKYREQRRYFAETGAIWADVYDPATDRIRLNSTIDCDVAFIQQPWGMQDLPRRLSGRVRTAYVHYGMPVIANDRMQFGLPDFHFWLWRHFVPTAVHAATMLASPAPHSAGIRVTGHPKFDPYLSPPPPRASGDQPRVIYAPHHGLDARSLGLGTFAWSGPAMLDLVRANPGIAFLLRPHPNMAIGLARAGLMNAQAWAAYRRDWEALPNGTIFEGGDYLDTFRTSDAMITDSGSFLAEYLPTGRPLIRLEREGAAPLNAFGQSLSGAFYRCSDRPGLETFFAEVVRAGQDPLADARARAAALLMPFERSAADVIAEDLAALVRP